MTREERENALHCLKAMIEEEVCEECKLYGTTGTDHCEADCVRVAIEALEQEPTTKNDLEVDWESYKDVDGNSLDDLILEVLQNNFDCGNTYGYKVADEIIGLLPSVTPQEPILDKIREWVERMQKMCDKDDLNWQAQYSAFGMVLDIIDKYKAESEG